MAGTVTSSGSNHLYVNHNIDKVFIFDNDYNTGLIDEPSGSGDTVLTEGQVIGRIASSGKLKICVSTANDGSQIPIGIVKGTRTLAQSSTNNSITYCM